MIQKNNCILHRLVNIGLNFIQSKLSIRSIIIRSINQSHFCVYIRACIFLSIRCHPCSYRVQCAFVVSKEQSFMTGKRWSSSDATTTKHLIFESIHKLHKTCPSKKFCRSVTKAIRFVFCEGEFFSFAMSYRCLQDVFAILYLIDTYTCQEYYTKHA